MEIENWKDQELAGSSSSVSFTNEETEALKEDIITRINLYKFSSSVMFITFFLHLELSWQILKPTIKTLRFLTLKKITRSYMKSQPIWRQPASTTHWIRSMIKMGGGVVGGSVVEKTLWPRWKIPVLKYWENLDAYPGASFHSTTRPFWAPFPSRKMRVWSHFPAWLGRGNQTCLSGLLKTR